MADIEQNLHSSKEALLDAFKLPHDKVIVDIGDGGKPSTAAEDGTLYILIDPFRSSTNIEWADNDPEEKATIVILEKPAEDLEIIETLRGKVDRVQLVAPDPVLAPGHVRAAQEMVKSGGEIVILFDKNSDKKQFIAESIDRIISELDSEFSVIRTSAQEEDPDDLVEGEINSEFNIGKILILTREV